MANLDDQVKVTCYGKTETMLRRDALTKYYDCMRNSEGAENERYQRIFFQLMEGQTDCNDVEGAIHEPELVGEMVSVPAKKEEEKPAPKPLPPMGVVKPKPDPKPDPIMKQYEDLKKKHPDAMLLFRIGDFYETYEEDAKEASEILGITLTKSTKKGYQMAGFPHHALDTYLPRLIRAGKRVAICDQLDEPKKLRTRGGDMEVKEVVTPGIAPTTNNDEGELDMSLFE